jgi:hypothetical protein
LQDNNPMAFGLVTECKGPEIVTDPPLGWVRPRGIWFSMSLSCFPALANKLLSQQPFLLFFLLLFGPSAIAEARSLEDEVIALNALLRHLPFWWTGWSNIWNTLASLKIVGKTFPENFHY